MRKIRRINFDKLKHEDKKHILKLTYDGSNLATILAYIVTLASLISAIYANVNLSTYNQRIALEYLKGNTEFIENLEIYEVGVKEEYDENMLIANLILGNAFVLLLVSMITTKIYKKQKLKTFKYASEKTCFCQNIKKNLNGE